MRKKYTQSHKIAIQLVLRSFLVLIVMMDGQLIFASVSVKTILYKYCRNELNLDLEALGNPQNIRFKSLGGDIQPHPAIKSKIALIPTRDYFELIISNESVGKLIPLDTLKFNVIDPPPPQIFIKIDGAKIGTSTVGTESTLEVMVKADSAFYNILPKDSRYQIEGLTIKTTCFGEPPRVIYSDSLKSDYSHVPKRKINLRELNLTVGCTLIVDINKVYRVSFQNREIEVTNELKDRVFELKIE